MIKKPIRIIYKNKVMNGSLFYYMYETVLFRIRCWQLFIFRVTWTGIDNTK